MIFIYNFICDQLIEAFGQMGAHLNTPGIIKFWWKNEIVQTPYQTIHQIPILDINKRETRISFSQGPIAILHFDNAQKSSQVLSKIDTNQKLKIYCIPNQNSKQSFETIKLNNRQSLGKMVLNGHKCHPLFRYLKKNCDQFYNYSTNTAQKNVSQPLGMFLIQRSSQPQNIVIKYYTQKQIESLKYLQKESDHKKLTLK